MVGRAPDMHLVLVRAGGEVEGLGLREDVALDEHRVRQHRLAEDALEQRQHVRMDAEPVQFLVLPHAAEHPHVAFLGVLAGLGLVGDALPDRMRQVEPAAFRGRLQHPAADFHHRIARQQPPDKEIAVALQPFGERRAVLHELGRIEETAHRIHVRILPVRACRRRASDRQVLWMTAERSKMRCAS